MMRKFFLFLAIFSFFVSAPKSATAQSGCGSPSTNVGPEIAVAEAGQNVIAAQNFTGVVSVINYLNQGFTTAENTVPNKSLNPVNVLRVDISANTPNSNIDAYAASLGARQGSEFPCGIRLIVLSVEANNLDWWYGTTGHDSSEAAIRQGAREYAAKFIRFAQQIRAAGVTAPLAPAPPDMFNGVFNADPWMSAFVESGACNYVDQNTADIFELTPTVGGGSYDWTNIHEYQIAHMCGKPITHFEGWGINPSEPSPGPDVRDQVEWYQSHSLPSGIQSASTLIKPICNGHWYQDEYWWYYLDGRVFKADGTEVNIDQCSSQIPPKDITGANFACYKDINNPQSDQLWNDRNLPYPTDLTNHPEFHSLRPYPACPFDPTPVDLTYYMCGSDLITKETVTIENPTSTPVCARGENPDYPEDGICQTPESCVDNGTSVTCNYEIHDREVAIEVDASDITFPIMGLTEDPEIANSDDPSFNNDMSWATRMNEYVSWYLNGSVYRAEENYAKFEPNYPEDGKPLPKDSHGNPISGGRRVIDLSGPINKILPWRVNLGLRGYDKIADQRIDQIGLVKSGQRRNQIVACVLDFSFGNIPVLEEAGNLFVILTQLFADILIRGYDPVAILDMIPMPCYTDKAKQEGRKDVVDVNNFPDQVIGRMRIASWEEGFKVYYNGILSSDHEVNPRDTKISDVIKAYDKMNSHDDFVEWYKKWHEFTGEFCTPTLDLGFEFFLCLDESNISSSLEGLVAQNFWGNMYMYIPLADTEDAIGFLETDLNFTLPPISDVQLGNVRFEPEGTQTSLGDGKFQNLYFPHMRETSGLSALLQDTYKTKRVSGYSLDNVRRYYDTQRCEIIDFRSNKGDRLHGDKHHFRYQDEIGIKGDIIYNGTFSCTFNKRFIGAGGGGGSATALCGADPSMVPGSTHCNVEQCQQYTCDPDGNNDGQWGAAEGCGVCSGFAACADHPNCIDSTATGSYTFDSCEIDIANAISMYTETPKVEEVYQRTVEGEQSIFKRIYPKLGEGRPIQEIKDIPGKSRETANYSSDTEDVEVLAGDPNVNRSGNQAQVFFPHLGSMYDYFLKGIQKALRPWSIGDYVESIAEPTPRPGNSTAVNCNQSVSDSSFPDVYKQSSEFFKNSRCASRGMGGVSDYAKFWSGFRGHAYIDECYNDAVARSLREGYNPAFTMLIWIEEGGASNYEDGDYFDFGVLGAIPNRNFIAQISFFLSAYDRYKQYYPTCFDGHNGYSEMDNFLAIYLAGYKNYTGHFWSEDQTCTPDPENSIAPFDWINYQSKIRDVWNQIMNWSCMSCPFPTSPKDNSCPAL